MSSKYYLKPNIDIYIIYILSLNIASIRGV